MPLACHVRGMNYPRYSNKKARETINCQNLRYLVLTVKPITHFEIKTFFH